MENYNIGRFCCDPFAIHKKKITNGIRVITNVLIEKNPQFNLTTNHKACINCLKKLAMNQSPGKLVHVTSDISEAESTDVELETLLQLDKINASFVTLDESPLKRSRISHSPHYAKKKLRKMESTVKRKLEQITMHSISSSESDDNAKLEIIEQLKEKFNEVKSRSEKLAILTVLPKSWSRKHIMDEFNCSQYMARQAKNLVKEKGVFSTPNLRLGKRLPSETAAKVIDFYHSPDISREMPGLKDYVSVKGADGNRERKQKFLILCNLKEAYEIFKVNHPTIKIGFSKFAELRPKECVLPGANGTHTVCVCTKHQNAKLMFTAIENIFKNENLGFENYPADEPGPSATSDFVLDTNYISHYRHCLSLLQCNPPQEICFLGECDNCPKEERFMNLLIALFDEKGIDKIEFRQWISTDRSMLELKSLSADDFVPIFHEKLKALLPHDFVAKAQMGFLREKKETLSEGELLVIGDFAENYSFIVQDAVQSFHWNNCQATLHPFVIYYRKDNELKHKSFVAISDCNQHDVIAVHFFQTRLINFLKSSHQITKIYYFSDGCAAQYKNRKNFLNICHHKNDFGIDAEWHFFATSHGKGPCDGIGGTVKRLAAKASLQRIGGTTPILNPLALYNFAVTALPAISFTFITSDDYEAHRQILEQRFKNARTIPGTQKIHSIRPISEELLEVRSYSWSTKSRLERGVIHQGHNKIQFASMKGYCLAVYDAQWYLACILEVKPESNEVSLSFLHPHGPSQSFLYPSIPDELLIDASDVLMIVSPNTMTGRTYTLSRSEMKKATIMLQYCSTYREKE